MDLDGETASPARGTVAAEAAPNRHTHPARAGSLVMFHQAGFRRGTLIATPAGPQAVETLRPGDVVATADGAHRRVQRIGVQIRNSAAGWDIRLLPGSLGGGLPSRDLFVLPDLALLIDGILFPARRLVNEFSITWNAADPRSEYIHLELDCHDAVLAEGAAAEAFLDRSGPMQSALESACRVEWGYALDEARQRLARITVQAA